MATSLTKGTVREVLPNTRSASENGNGTVARPLRIAQLAPPFERVPPQRYGGTERVIAVLTEELVRRGHQVTLFASADSQTSARLVPIVDLPIWRDPRYTDALPFLMTAIDLVYGRAEEFDVIHNHVGYFAFPRARVCPTPTVTTLHGRLDLPELAPLFAHFNDLPVVSISDAQRVPLPSAHWLATVHHGLDLRPFTFQPRAGDYLAFLGRIAPEKGLDTAIEVARRAGMRLKIAARMPLNIPDPEAQRDWRYYHEVIEPLLKLPGIEYVGEVGDDAKSAFLGGAAALLFPIRWPEPFGLVMVEALACGTPVVALRAGSVPEVIDHGVTGFVLDDVDAMVRAIDRLGEIDRQACRRAAETRFSAAAMAGRYEHVYWQLVTGDVTDVVTGTVTARSRAGR
ncbi:MAG: glycosyl transferase [Chloroflexota bacterium]